MVRAFQLSAPQRIQCLARVRLMASGALLLCLVVPGVVVPHFPHRFPAHLAGVGTARAQQVETPQPDKASDKPYLKARREFLGRFQQAARTDPDAAIVLLRRFWQESAAQKPDFLIVVADEAALILFRQDRANVQRPLQVLDETLARFPKARVRLLAVKTKAQILREAGQLEDAMTLLSAAWPQAQNRILDPVMFGILTEGVTTLRAQKKPEAALVLLQQAITTAPPLANWMSFYPMLIETLQDAGKDPEAWRWTALYFRVCPFTEAEIGRATALVTRGWIKAGAADKPVAFSQAQTQADAPNPLQETPLPPLPASLREALTVRVSQEKTATSTRITLHLVLGDYQAAMLDAREMTLKAPTEAQGVLEVARVFKAADGDVARANAYLKFYKTGQGENPMKAFLSETTQGLNPQTTAPPAETPQAETPPVEAPNAAPAK